MSVCMYVCMYVYLFVYMICMDVCLRVLVCTSVRLMRNIGARANVPDPPTSHREEVVAY